MSSENEKYQIGTKNGNILWNISELYRSIIKGNYKIIKMNVKELVSCNTFNGNADYAMETAIKKPCVVVELCIGKVKLIDGNHRLYKASKLNIETINCYYLTKSEHIKYIINYDSEIYNKVVNEF